MRLLRDISIRQKLTRIVMLTCSVVVLLACIAFAVYDITTYRRNLAIDLSTVAEIVGQNTAAALTFNDPESAHETLNSLQAKPHVVAACIYGPDGSVFARYNRPGSNPGFVPPPPAGDGISIELGHFLLFRQIRLQGEAVGTIYMKYDLGLLYARAVGFLGMTAVIITVCLLLAYLLASRLQRVVSGPILELARTAFTVSDSKDYSIRARKQSEDETGYLYDRFNEMLGQIEQREATLQRAREELETRVDERTSELQKEIAERIQTERELEERTTFLNGLIENSPLAIVVLDPEYRVRLCNPAFQALFQYPAAEIVGRDLDSWLAPGDLLLEAREMMAENLTGKSVHVFTRRRRRDKSLVDVEVFGVPLVVGGKSVGVLRMYQDITHRKQAEAALLQAKEEAEAANRAKSEFLANMSHEIRTPMNGIIGMTALALDTELSNEQREYLGMVKSSADSLLKLINDILDFSRIEAGKFELEVIDFPLRQNLGEILKTLGLRAHEKGVSSVQLGSPCEQKRPAGALEDIAYAPGFIRLAIASSTSASDVSLVISLFGFKVRLDPSAFCTSNSSLTMLRLSILHDPCGKDSKPANNYVRRPHWFSESTACAGGWLERNLLRAVEGDRRRAYPLSTVREP